MTNQRIRLKGNLLIRVIASIVIFLFADRVGNIYGEVHKNNNGAQKKTQVIEKMDMKKNAEIEEKSPKDKIPQEENVKNMGRGRSSRRYVTNRIIKEKPEEK